MITTVIVSKDKPAQLHLLLESLYRNSSNLFDIHVLYESTTQPFDEGYLKTKFHFYNKTKYGSGFPPKWYQRKEDDICRDILGLIGNSRPLVCFMSDENILFSHIAPYIKIKNLFDEYSLSALSLRLGNNTVLQNAYDQENYFADIPSNGKFVMDRFLVWDATEVKPFTNFAMPFSFNGHVYAKNLIQKVLEQSASKDRDTFESDLQKRLYEGRFNGKISPLMACPEYSVLLTNTSTKISDDDHTDLGISDLEINERYINGKIIDYNFFDFAHVSKPFQDFLTRFKDESNLHYSR